MSGRRIDDHSFWGGKGGKGSVLPLGSKMKDESSAEGAGEIMHYPDTTEAIKATQMTAKSKVHGHHIKPGNRN